MKEHFQQDLEIIQSEHRRDHVRRFVALALVLAIVASLFAGWDLRREGYALSDEEPHYYCGKEEHIHDASCYKEELVCPYADGEEIPVGAASGSTSGEDNLYKDDKDDAGEEPAESGDADIALYAQDEGSAAAAEGESTAASEAEPEVKLHHHTSACYKEEKVLTCDIDSDHVHDSLCYDQETHELTCPYHQHDDSCYSYEDVLVCGYEEGEPESDASNSAASAEASASSEEPRPVVVEPDASSSESEADSDSSADQPAPGYVIHHHTEACYESVLICKKEEHIHTAECLENPNAAQDEQYEEATPARTADNWPDDMVKVAESQLGYTESTVDVDAEGSGYTLYAAQYYGDKPATYADWDASFVAYCLYHAGVPSDVVPQYAGINALRSELKETESPYYSEDASAFASIAPGDIALYQGDTRETIGVVTAAEQDADGRTTGLTVVSGDVPQFDSDKDADVDRVAEVNVPLDRVTGAISVNAAYAAQQEEEQEGEEKKDEPTGESEDYTKIENLNPTTTIKVKIGGQGDFQDLPEGYEIQDGDVIRVDVDFKTEGSKSFPENEEGIRSNTLTYHFPIKLKNALTNEPIYKSTTDQKQVGTYNVTTDGLATLDFFTTGEHVIDFNLPYEGHFWVEDTVDLSGMKDGEKIQFPGLETSITIRRPEDYEIKKENVDGVIKKDENGNYIEYKVTVTSKNGTGSNKLTISDIIQPGNGIKGAYTDFNLTHTTKDGEETIAIDQNLKDNLQRTDSAFGVAASAPSDGQTIWAGYAVYTATALSGNQSFELPDLPPLGEGESYTLTYRYRLEEDSALDGSVNNTATVKKEGDATGKSSYANTTFKKALEKTGEYDVTRQRVKWTITIRNPNKESLDRKTLSDVLNNQDERPSAADLIGPVEIWAGENETQLRKNATWTPQESETDSIHLFDYTFPEGSNEGCYRLVYYTTVPADETMLVNNVEFNDHTASAEVDTTAKRNWNVSKGPGNSANFESVEKDGETLSRMRWYATICPERGTTTFTVQDSLQDPETTTTNDMDPGDNFALYGELKQQLENDTTNNGGVLEFYMTNRSEKSDKDFLNLSEIRAAGATVAFHYYADANCETELQNPAENTHVKGFKIEIDTSSCSYGNVYKLNLGSSWSSRRYYSYVDLSENGHTTENEWKIQNTIQASVNNIVKDTGSASYIKYQGKDTLKKYVGSSYNTCTNPQKTFDYSKLSNGEQSIWFGLLFTTDFEKNTAHNHDTIELVDELPAGMKLDEQSKVYLLFKRESGYSEKVDGYNTENIWATVAAKTSLDEETGRQTVTFTVTGVNNIPEQYRTFKGIQVSFKVSIDGDEHWKEYTNTTKNYPNTASWDGIKSNTATAIVNRDGTFFANKTVDTQSSDKSRVSYTIDVNPEGRVLLGENGTIKLTDTFTVPKNVTAEIDRKDVHWLDEAGNDKSAEYNEKFEILPAETRENGETVYTMVFSLPDGVHLKIKYTYQLTFGINAGQNITVTNAANLEGQKNQATSTTTNKTNGGASGSNSGQLIIYKVDAQSAAKTLPDAHFRLEQYADGSWTETYADLTTDNEGRLLFAPSAAKGYQQLNTNTLYRLTETKAPQNYNLNPDPVYFIWMGKDKANTDEKRAEALKAATNGNGAPEGVENIHYFLYGQNNQLDVQDTFNTKLTLTKKWADCLGETLETAPNLEVRFKLFRTSIADTERGYELVTTDASGNAVASEVTLNQANNWTYQWDNLDPDYTYEVEEEPIAGGNEEGYQPVYTYSNGADDALTSAPYNGTITVTNQEKPGLPMVMKKVKENVKTANASGTETDVHVPGYPIPAQYNDAADYSIGDAVPFQLVGTLPEDLNLYMKGYYYQFVDKQAKGLTLDESSVKVALKQRDGTEVADLTGTAAVTKTDDGFTVTFENLLAALCDEAEAVKSNPLGYIIVVDYTAALNANAAIGLPGNENSVYLSYADEPGNSDSRDTTAEDHVIVFTYQLTTTKVDENNAALSGVEFVLSRQNGEAKEYALLDEGAHVTGWTTDAKKATPLVSGEDGVLQAIGLDDGTYYLTETNPRPGYNALFEDIEVVISADTVHSQTWDGTPATALTGLNVSVKNAQSAAADADTGTVKVSIVNSKGTMLPSTGGRGTTVYDVVGGTLMAAAAAGLVWDRKRRSKQ